MHSHLQQQQFHGFDLVRWTLAWLQNQNLKFNSTFQPALLPTRAEFGFATNIVLASESNKFTFNNAKLVLLEFGPLKALWILQHHSRL